MRVYKPGTQVKSIKPGDPYKGSVTNITVVSTHTAVVGANSRILRQVPMCIVNYFVSCKTEDSRWFTAHEIATTEKQTKYVEV